VADLIFLQDRTKRLTGKYMQIVMTDLVDVMGGKPFSNLDLDEEQKRDLLTRAKEELYNTNYHTYINYYFLSAQKPE
jgi:hypothetical protein